jgi:hypothetical protein
MSEQEFVIALVAIVAGTGITIFLLHTIVSFVKFLIGSRSTKSSGELVTKQEFEEMRGRLERRMQTLEAIVIDEEHAQRKQIELDPDSYEAPASGLKNKLKTR